MTISIGYNTYCCFSESSGIKFTQQSSKELNIGKDAHFSSFEECKELVAKYHNVDVKKLQTNTGVMRSLYRVNYISSFPNDKRKWF